MGSCAGYCAIFFHFVNEFFLIINYTFWALMPDNFLNFREIFVVVHTKRWRKISNQMITTEYKICPGLVVFLSLHR